VTFSFAKSTTPSFAQLKPCDIGQINIPTGDTEPDYEEPAVRANRLHLTSILKNSSKPESRSLTKRPSVGLNE
jgi:hypothetical protein